MIRSLYTQAGYVGHYAFTRENDAAGDDSPHGWGATASEARADLAGRLGLVACPDCEFGPCDMNCGPRAAPREGRQA